MALERNNFDEHEKIFMLNFFFHLGPSDGGNTGCIQTAHFPEIKELKEALNFTRRQLDIVRSELKRQNATITNITSKVSGTF